ncbi:hypothetical protein [Streptacidiphilus neutrinimicus]|uniref:hypothetical protein n=1 Tax=Streptacidiphilus neutrinimicus TaxID=105420 RepID=UPI0005AAFCFB|nr:hypothetical protein [Streptacidiphilus neutrinimicus]
MTPNPSRAALAAAATALLLLTSGGGAQAAGTPGTPRAMQPHAVIGRLIPGGADGTEHSLMCPPDENVLGGGFTVSAPPGRQLAPTPDDVLSSRPTADATGWTVAVDKATLARHNEATEPADLTLQIVCTEGQTAPGD